MDKFSIILFFLMVHVFGAENKETIAVSLFEARGLPLSDAQIITDRFRIELGKRSNFIVMEREKMDEILEEQSFQQSGACSSTECTVEMGRLLGLEKILTGEVGKFGQTYTLSARVIDVESGQIKNSASSNFNGVKDQLLTNEVPFVLEKLFNPQGGISKKEVLKNPSSLEQNHAKKMMIGGWTYTPGLYTALGIPISGNTPYLDNNNIVWPSVVMVGGLLETCKLSHCLTAALGYKAFAYGVDKDEASVVHLVSHLEIPIQYSFRLSQTGYVEFGLGYERSLGEKIIGEYEGGYFNVLSDNQYSFSIGIKTWGESDRWFLRYHHSLNNLYQGDNSISIYSIQLGWQGLFF